MMEIYGRDSQCLSLKGVLYSERDIARFMDISGVLLYQLIQNDEGITIHVLLEQMHAGNDKRNKKEGEIRSKFGELGVSHITVAFVNYIKPENSGKFKIVNSVN